MLKFTVMGDPIKHSLSPLIHAEFAQQAGIELEYTRTHVPAEKFAVAVDKFQNQGGLGANITVPLKELAYQYATNLSSEADKAQAVNTIHFKADEVYGHNTDGLGLVSDLIDNYNIDLQDKNILLLGAGGAARGVALPLLNQGVALVIANRTEAKAAAIANEFADFTVLSSGLDNIQGSFDVIINATTTSLKGEALALDRSLVHKDTLCYDMMYAREPTPFMLWAESAGAAQAVDGLGMLVSQAAHSFNLWHNFMPEVAPVLAGLRRD